jgi:hypothetical protein
VGGGRMKVVFVVGVGYYTGLTVVKIFSTREKAEEFCKGPGNYYDIEEREVE